MSIEGRYVELSPKKPFCLKWMAKWDLFPLSLLENVPIAEHGNPRKDRIACPASPQNAIFREITRSTYSDVGTSLSNSTKKKTDNRIAVTTKFHDSTKHL